jgi:hypothetical protein
MDRDEVVEATEENTLAAALPAPHTRFPAIIKLFFSLHLIRAFQFADLWMQQKITHSE